MDASHTLIKLKAAVSVDTPVHAAHLNSLNHNILQHNEEIWQNTYQCLYRCHFGPRLMWQLILASLQASLHVHIPCTHAAPGMHHTVKLRYSVDNPGQVGSTPVYLPSWIRVNTVCKVAYMTNSHHAQLIWFLECEIQYQNSLIYLDYHCPYQKQLCEWQSKVCLC